MLDTMFGGFFNVAYFVAGMLVGAGLICTGSFLISWLTLRTLDKLSKMEAPTESSSE